MNKKESLELAFKFKVFIKTKNIDEKFLQIAVGSAIDDEELSLLEEFQKENVEVFSLLNDIIASVSVNDIDMIGLLDKDKGFFVSYEGGCLYFTLPELSKMLLNHNLFKKANRIYCDFLKGNGFQSLIMT